jgi:lipopolysaccharide/colanic/teichoic acid biosynthesis glycosyltransferase
MKEFLNDTTSEIDRILNSNLLFDEKRIVESNNHFQERNQIYLSKRTFLDKAVRKSKRLSEFSSLERIRIIVDALIGDDSEKEICKKEGISFKVFLQWKEDFYEAFNEFSEVSKLQKALTSKNKEVILNESSKEVFDFYQTFTDITSHKSLVISKKKLLSNYNNFKKVKNLILLDKINNFRLINKQLEKANDKLPFGGILMGSFETSNCRNNIGLISKIPVLKSICSSIDFIIHRVWPKLAYVNKLYYFITKGKNRSLSKAEALGRLVSCGFDILDYKVIDGIHYFAAIKIKEPVYDMNPSYGPLFKMQRVGKNGKMIGVYKLRTMHPYSEYLQDYILKLNGYAETGKPANDFRLVPWGKYFRRYWIDELPQLINLFKGELKLVGARPVSLRYFKDIPKEIQELRITQKPGCIPPYVALNARGSVKEVLEAEKKYLQEKIRKPYVTDTKYFFNALYNILFRGKRSA